MIIITKPGKVSWKKECMEEKNNFYPFKLQCVSYCLQRLWKCGFVKTTLLQTESRGWGLPTNDNIKAIVTNIS